VNALRTAIVLVIIALWGAFVPVAMAADHCAAMNGMCMGPCGASSTAAAPAVPVVIELVSRAVSEPAPTWPQTDRPTLEPPPRSSDLLA
jgi:hypothetical protein